jgi:Fe-S oxidoreductase
MAKLKSEFLHAYYEKRPRPLGQRLMTRIYRLNRLGLVTAPLVNWMQRRRSFRWLLEKTAGIDRRRSLPPIRPHQFRRWFVRHAPPPNAGRYGRVLLLDDCFMSLYEPQIGRAAVRVLEHAGYTVELARLTCCCRPMISKGMLEPSRRLVQEQAPRLAARLADGLPILGLEPSCLLTLSDEWPELVPGPETRQIAAAAELADGWLARQAKEGRCGLVLSPRAQKTLLHGHCHQKALTGVAPSASALRMVPHLKVETLDAGCCGMAGSFGFEREHYDLSVAIAGLALLPALAADPEALVVATGTSCRHQIKDLAGRKALHPLEVLAAGLPEEPKRRARAAAQPSTA